VSSCLTAHQHNTDIPTKDIAV